MVVQEVGDFYQRDSIELALRVLTTPLPSPPEKIEIWAGLGTLSFDFASLPPPPEN